MKQSNLDKFDNILMYATAVVLLLPLIIMIVSDVTKFINQ